MMQRLFSMSTISRSVGVLITAGFFIFCQSENAKKQTSSAEPEKVAVKDRNIDSAGQRKDAGTGNSSNHKLIVYYFHGNFRCHSCTMIEALTKQAVNSGFSDQLKNGRIELKVINIEEPGNEHFVDDYKLYTKSVILSDVNNDREVSWKNCEKVWTLLGNEQKFIKYIQSEVKTLL